MHVRQHWHNIFQTDEHSSHILILKERVEILEFELRARCREADFTFQQLQLTLAAALVFMRTRSIARIRIRSVVHVGR